MSKLPPLAEGLKSIQFSIQRINRILNPKSQLTGIKDVDREILSHLPDKELLTVCTIDKRFWNEVCDDDFLKRRLRKYPGIEKYKGEESWKKFFLRLVYYMGKMKEDFKFEYRYGDFKQQHELLKRYKGNYLLTESVRLGHLPLVKFAVEQGADIQTDDNLSLRRASENGDLEMVRYLVEHGAHINAGRNSGSYSALEMASTKGDLEIVKYLVEQGAYIQNMSLIWASRNGNSEVVKYLVEHGANIHTGDNAAIRMADMFGHKEVVKYLIEHGADIN